MLRKLDEFWRSYKYRFVPWLAFNFRNRSVRRVCEGEGGVRDEVVSRTDIVDQLTTLTSALGLVSYRHRHHRVSHHHHTLPQPDYHQQALDVMEGVLGFRVYRAASELGGLGVVADVSHGGGPVEAVGGDGGPLAAVSGGGSPVAAVGGGGPVVAVKRGQLVGLYPGTLYLPHQPIFFQSINNSFIFRCADGILIDGNDKRLSKFLFKSCCGRDRVGPLEAADTTWLTGRPLNPLNVGQYVNNQSSGRRSNVAYQEVTLQPSEVREEHRCLLPNLWCAPPPHLPSLHLPLRLVALVATREIISGEELFSDYFTVIH